MNFRSDNTAPVAPEIMKALAHANEPAHATAYGADEESLHLQQAFGDLFEREVKVFTVASGTAANSIALASMTSPWGAILCHREAHIECDEGGAPTFFTGGAKLVLMDGAMAKANPAAVEEAAARNARGIHSVLPQALSITQATERGAAYRPDEVAALGETARRLGLALHMDGARFANAVAALGCKPAEITWRAGVDVLSFGATKNGALAAEAIVCFNPARAEGIERQRKRGGHLFSKGRFVAAQFRAYLADDLWLKLAGRANQLAHRIGEAAGPHLSHRVDTNQVFISSGPGLLQRLREQGVEFYDWGPEGGGEARLVVSWNQSESDVDALCAMLRAMR